MHKMGGKESMRHLMGLRFFEEARHGRHADDTANLTLGDTT